jgi:peptidoglycan/LPS O-acetylase OafA/YrhL
MPVPSLPPAVPERAGTADALGPVAPEQRRHFPALEGLRALAASLVVIHHAFVLSGHSDLTVLGPLAGRMDFGVSVFFVLSGFLIYRPFVVSHLDDRPGTSTPRFLWRRVLRVVPAYWAALSVLWALGVIDLGGPGEAVRYYLFLQVYATDTVLGGITQAWSLCTEMAFYLLVPLVALAVRAGARRLAAAPWQVEAVTVAALYAVGVTSRLVAIGVDGWWRPLSFTWMPMNLDLFAVGMGLAVASAWAASTGRQVPVAEALAGRSGLCWAAAGALFAAFALLVPTPTLADGGSGGELMLRQFLFGVVALLLILPGVFGDQGRGVVRRVLRLPVVVWIGVMSYGLYLWHLDVMSQLGADLGPSGEIVGEGWIDGAVFGNIPLGALLLAGFGLGLACAAASYYVMEKPLLRFKGRR